MSLMVPRTASRWQQELDLVEITPALPTELGAGSPKVMRPQALDPDLLGGLLDDGPDGPIAQRLAPAPSHSCRPTGAAGLCRSRPPLASSRFPS